MLNCSDVACMLHHHEESIQHHLQDDRAHHEHQVQVMSGETSADVKDIIQNILNGTDELSSLSHLDAPNESLYMVCGVLGAMLLVALIIILLAVTISKLRKREEGSATAPAVAPPPELVTSSQQLSLSSPPPPPPPAFLWSAPPARSDNADQANLMGSRSSVEGNGECRGLSKNLSGKWRRLVRKKPPSQEVYTIPAELRDQLKQIYVY